MKATLEFDLPAEQYEFDCARTGSRWQSEMRAFDQWMRSIEKHGGEAPADVHMTPAGWQEAVRAVRERFWQHVPAAGGFAEDA